MNIEDNPSDIIFKETLENYESVPPPEIWGKIDGALKRKQRTRFIAIIAFTLIGLSAISLSVFNYQHKTNNPNTTATVQQLNTSSSSNNQKTNELNEVPVSEQNQNEDIQLTKPEQVTLASTKESHKNDENKGQQPTAQQSAQQKKLINPIELKPSALALTQTNDEEASSTQEVANLSVMKTNRINYSAQNLNKPLNLDQDFDWVNPSFAKANRFIIGLTYSPIFTNKQLVSPADIPMKSTILQDNLLDQTVVGYDMEYSYSHQYGVIVGYSATSKLDLMVGAQYSNWSGNADLYLENTYEIKSTYTKEIITKETVQEIVKQSNNGGLNTPKDLEKIIINTGGSITTTPFSGNIDPKNISTNEPTDRVITRTETTVSYEEVTIYENMKYYDTIQTKFNYSYYEIPLLLRYKLGNGNLKLHITGGFSTFIGSKLKLESTAISQQNRSSNAQTTRPSFKQWNGLLGAGIIYSPFHNWSMVLSPQMKVNLNQDNDSGGGINAFGIQGGIEYSF
ncbi:MAG: hypothetical protein CL840_07515 [Crocinitomicaceae bacterium]|nr:hypothetical protein [Crocinitomicaceae bacterium]|tara:strand:- start:8849 stop:10378 length:1530 start_codon:yes stop_codon:yes gene_type:complete